MDKLREAEQSMKRKRVYAKPDAIEKEVKKQKTTYIALAIASSSTRVTIGNIRRGKPTTVFRAREIADVLGVPFEQLFEWR